MSTETKGNETCGSNPKGLFCICSGCASTNKRDIQIWAEGYRASGDSSGATYMGTEFASSLKEACDMLAKRDQGFAKYYDSKRLTHWGCELFDNEADARRHFG